MENTLEFEKNGFIKRLKSMLSVDLRRMVKSRLFYIMLGIALVMPILIVVMTTMMDGTVTTDPNTGVTTVIEGFKNAWQSIGSVSGSAMTMDLTGMCNINLIYFAIAVFICLFIADDFRSGYSKNLFTVRAKKDDYVISKTIVCFICGVSMLLLYFVGALLGAAISNLPFSMEGFNTTNLVMCMLSKIFLMGVFVAIFVLISVGVKQRSWLSMCISLGGGMLLFMMIPVMTPLDANIMNVILCLAGGIIFSIGLGAISKLILKKTNLV